MLVKVAGLVRALTFILAIVAGFIAIPNLNMALVLVVLGLIAGLAYTAELMTILVLSVLALPAVGAALTAIPAVGIQLGAVANNLAVAAAGSVATMFAIGLYKTGLGDLAGLGGKSEGGA